MKKIETENGYILVDGDSEIDPDSMIDPSELYSSIGSSINNETGVKPKKEIKLIKDEVEYCGFLTKFLLKETSEGKRTITVVFDLKS